MIECFTHETNRLVSSIDDLAYISADCIIRGVRVHLHCPALYDELERLQVVESLF